MKLLFDQNISYRILPLIKNHYPEATQVKHVGLHSCKDIEIWRYARENDFVIVTFDSDFKEFSTLFGHPPKIIWLRFGNTTTRILADFFNKRAEVIFQFIHDEKNSDLGCLEFIRI